jgi:multisubunit Na+/H+ antiporter MnhG subunit
VRPLSVDVLLALALLTELICVIGVLCSATAYDRLHFSGATTAVAPFLVFAALVVEQQDHSAMWNGLFDALALFTLNSVLSHAIARVALQRETGELEL